MKLIDFGLSSPYSEHIKLPRTTGTRGFYAPELEGLVLKKKSIIIFFFIVGHFLFENPLNSFLVNNITKKKLKMSIVL